MYFMCGAPGGEGESAIESRPGPAPDLPGPLYVLYVWSPSLPEYKKVTVAQLVKRSPLGVKVPEFDSGSNAIFAWI